MTSHSKDSRGLTAADVLRRYKDEDLPAFFGIELTDVNQVGLFDERPLHVASTRGVIEEIAALIDAGADVNASGELGNTTLHEAVGQDHLQAVRFLLERGACPTAENEDGLTPLDIAKLGKRFGVAALLEGRRDGQT